MAIHYDRKLKRFRNDKGRFVKKQNALKSSIARAEYLKEINKKKRLNEKRKLKRIEKKLIEYLKETLSLLDIEIQISES